MISRIVFWKVIFYYIAKFNYLENKRHKIQVAQVKLDPEFIKTLEKKHLVKEAQLVEDIDRLQKGLNEKEKNIAALNAEMRDLTKSSFAPRMEALSVVENGIQFQLEEISVAEEKLEVIFRLHIFLG